MAGFLLLVPRVRRRYPGRMDAREREDRARRWQSLPKPVRLEDLTAAQAVEPGRDSTWDVDYERYWAAQEASWGR
ncbi:hypothetical protein CU254_31285 [Amycolatopsis sp. AA4]|nr:hypothetical protein CU254_31285 [Amycolatopsis sp. AA4]EFL10490.1 predicted protein [Streptomyces sp. AA4]